MQLRRPKEVAIDGSIRPGCIEGGRGTRVEQMWLQTATQIARSRVGALMLGRRVGKGEAHKSATVDHKMKVSQGKHL